MQNYNSKFKSDLKHRCFQFSLDTIEIINQISDSRANRVISDQLIRSATSIGANLVESGASSSRLEYKKFHEIALKSANETKYWLALLREINPRLKDKINVLLSEVNELANMLASGILKLKGKI